MCMHTFFVCVCVCVWLVCVCVDTKSCYQLFFHYSSLMHELETFLQLSRVSQQDDNANYARTHSSMITLAFKLRSLKVNFFLNDCIHSRKNCLKDLKNKPQQVKNAYQNDQLGFNLDVQKLLLLLVSQYILDIQNFVK